MTDFDYWGEEKPLVSFHVPEHMLKMLKELAEKRGVTLSDIVRAALYELLEKWGPAISAVPPPPPDTPGNNNSSNRARRVNRNALRRAVLCWIADEAAKSRGFTAGLKPYSLLYKLCGFEASRKSLYLIVDVLKEIGVKWRDGVYLVDKAAARQMLCDYDVEELRRWLCFSSD